MKAEQENLNPRSTYNLVFKEDVSFPSLSDSCPLFPISGIFL